MWSSIRGSSRASTEPEDPTRRRNVEILRDYSQRPLAGKSHRLELRFLRSPVEILGDGEDGPVTGVRAAINRLVTGDDGRVSAEPTGEEEVIECGLVLRSIGYRGVALPGVPFDERRGLIRNEGGRVIDDAGPCCGEYAVGWIKRGPSGVIGTNKKDAADTVARITEDAEAGALNEPDAGKADADAVGGVADRARPRPRHLGRLGGDRRPRVGPRRASRPAPGQAGPSRGVGRGRPGPRPASLGSEAGPRGRGRTSTAARKAGECGSGGCGLRHAVTNA